ncbi:MAG: hypothetical protein ABI551_26910 [Polyangiaceae bacterium]
MSASATASAAASCTESTAEAHGSLHAEVAWSTVMEPPKSKRKQAFTCDGKSAAALFLEYATAAQAQKAGALTGAQLWGGAAPTSEDPDELMTKNGSLVIVSGDAIDALANKLQAEGYVQWRAGTHAPASRSIDAQLAAAVDCTPSSKDPLRAWCPATHLSSSGFSFPTAPTTYVGISVAVKTGTPLRSALLDDVTVTALALGNGRVRVTSIKPDNASEKKALASTAMAVAAALKGMSPGNIAVGSDLAGFLDSLRAQLPTKGYAAAASSGKPASYTGATPSEIALVKGSVDAYVVIEHAPDGTWLDVYPVRPYGP